MRRTALALLGVAGSLTMIGVTTAASRAGADIITECEEAVAWVAQNMGNLPDTYDEFASHSEIYRKAIYSKLPDETRVRLWREHLDRFTALHSLAESQMSFMSAVDGRLAFYIEDASDDERMALRTEARRVLGDLLTKRAFYNLGSPDLDGVAQEACPCHIGENLNRADDSFDGDCPPNYECGEDGDGCDEIENSCGFLNTQTCNGECLSIG